MIKRVQLPPFLFSKLTKILIRNILLLPSIKVLENHVDLIDLIFDPEMVKGLLEFIEAYSVIKINIKISISMMDRIEFLLNLYPEQIHHSVK